MRVVRAIPIQNIIVDRHSISPQTLSIAKHMESGGSVPPIKVVCLNGSYILRDGRHRVTAAKLLGLTTIDAKFYKKVETDETN